VIPLLLAGLAQAGEYRRLDLADGRVLTVEVLGSEATGLVVRVPQGTLHLPYEEVLTITPVEPSAYAAVGPLRILVVPFTAVDPATGDDAGRVEGIVWNELDALPATEVLSLGQVAARTGEQAADALSRCGADVACVRAGAGAYDVDVVVSGTVSGSGGEDLALAAAWPAAPQAGETAATKLDGPLGESARRAVYTLFGYEVPSAAPVAVAPVPVPQGVPTVVPPVVAVVPEPAPHRTVPVALAAVPLPGFTAFMGGDVAHGLAATALVLPATVGIVYTAGASSSRAEEVVGLSIAGWWALCAVTNVAWMPRVLPTLRPTEGGATLGVGGAF
jgi:hypothetical protein